MLVFNTGVVLTVTGVPTQTIGKLQVNSGTAVTLQYDGDGNRVAKTVGGMTTRYLVDDLNPTGYPQVVEELVGGAAQRTYTYLNLYGYFTDLVICNRVLPDSVQDAYFADWVFPRMGELGYLGLHYPLEYGGQRLRFGVSAPLVTPAASRGRRRA